MALAERLEHRIIIGPVDKTLEEFTKTAPRGSELNIINENAAEMITIVEFPNAKAIAKEASKTAKDAKNRLSRALKEGITSSPVVRTLKRVH